MPHVESDKHFGRDTHGIMSGKPRCPECRSENVIEQGFPHNHRHHCWDCKVTYWITRF
jgi:transposase-like protein